MSASEDPSGGGRGRRLQQAPGLWRAGLQQHDLSALRRVVVQRHVEIGAGATLVGRTHPGEEIHVLEGSLVVPPVQPSAVGHTSKTGPYVQRN